MSESKENKEVSPIYALVHQRVRNDYHCPICRRYYVSFHKSSKTAVEFAKNKITKGEDIENDDLKEKLEDLESVHQCWIDEWVRRRNGDWYQIKPINNGDEWNLTDFCEQNTVDKRDEHPQFMMLHIQVNKKAWCPENIQFFLTFHSTIKDAEAQARDIPLVLHKDSYDYKTQTLQFVTFPDVDQFIWIEESESVGHHIQLFSITLGDELELNSFCEHIQPENWTNAIC
jgi:hypothetical protein